MSTHAKRDAARRALEQVESGMRLGLGSGSTAARFVELLAERLDAGGLSGIAAVPTSQATATLARRLGIALTDLDATPALDLTVDGADEVDPQLRLIKGGGGALLREKIVARASQRVVIIVDAGKCVPRLGAFRLPVEVVPFARRPLSEALAARGLRPHLRRRADGQPFTTDGGNHILDLDGLLDWPEPLEALAARLDAMSGVVEHGLFLEEADQVLVGADRTLTR